MKRDRQGVLQHIGRTPLVPLERIARGLPVRVLVKCEHLNPGGSIKDRIAVAIVEDAEEREVLHPGMTLIEATAGNTGVGYDAKTATVALTGRIPLGGFLSLTGKTGYMYWSTDVTLTGTVIDPHFTEGTDHGRDWFYGAGARLEFGHVAVIGEWERYKLSDLDINAVSAGLRYTF